MKLTGEAREVARAELQALYAAVRDEERRGRLAALLAEVDEGELVDGDALAEVLELGLQSGRIRGLYGPEAEAETLRLYRRLPAGQELGAAARGVSEALTALEGRVLEQVTVQATGPAAHTVTIAADGLELQVRLDRSGARLATVAL